VKVKIDELINYQLSDNKLWRSYLVVWQNPKMSKPRVWASC